MSNEIDWESTVPPVMSVIDVAKMLRTSVSTIWRWSKTGEFPKPFSIGQHTTVWSTQELFDYIEIQKAKRV